MTQPKRNIGNLVIAVAILVVLSVIGWAVFEWMNI